MHTLNSKNDFFFSVVIPTFERPEDLRKCLSSIDYKQQINPPSYEIIVTDDSKSNETKKLVLENFPCLLGKRKTKWACWQ